MAVAKIKVIVVDDSAVVRQVNRETLARESDIEVLAACPDPVAALEKMRVQWPDVIVTDIEMPRMDGFEVTNLVRHHDIHQDLPIIMITSRTGEKHRERAFSLGATQYMGKPFQEAELLANIESLIAEKQG